jgi:hypothetical protein
LIDYASIRMAEALSKKAGAMRSGTASLAPWRA